MPFEVHGVCVIDSTSAPLQTALSKMSKDSVSHALAAEHYVDIL
jgi:hypothetical protein